MSKAKNTNRGTAKDKTSHHEDGLSKEVIQAHTDAEQDIQNDSDMEIGDKDDDLDEGELARLDNSND